MLGRTEVEDWFLEGLECPARDFGQCPLEKNG